MVGLDYFQDSNQQEIGISHFIFSLFSRNLNYILFVISFIKKTISELFLSIKFFLTRQAYSTWDYRG